jgi:hypothetical protein
VNFRPGSNPSQKGTGIQMTRADSVHSTPPTNTSAIDQPMFPPRAEPAYSFVRQTEVQLRPWERETVAALLGFVVCGLKCGSTLEQMQAIAMDELERSRKAAEKIRRQELRRSQLHSVEVRQ